MKKMVRRILLVFVFIGTFLVSMQANVLSESSTGVSFQVVKSRGYAYEGSSTNYYVVDGVVQNTGTSNATNIYVKAEIFWSTGTKRGENQIETDIRILRPGETSPFHVRVEYIAPELIDRYTLAVAGAPTNEQPYQDIAVINELMRVEDSSRILRGEIHNIGNRTLDGNDLTSSCIFYGSNGRILGYDWSWPLGYNDGNLGPGMTAPFYFYTSLFDEVTSWEVWTQAKPLAVGIYPASLDAQITSSGQGPGEWDDFIIHGTATNNSSVSVDEYQTCALFRDSEGGLLSFSTESHGQWSDLPSPLQPGASAEFTHEVWSWDVPDSYASLEIQTYTRTTVVMPTPEPSPTPTQTATSSPTPTKTLTPAPTLTPSPTNTLFPTPEGGWPYWLYLPLMQKGVS